MAREQFLAAVDRLAANPDRARRTTLVVVTHHLEELPRATAQVLLLQDGTAAAQGPPSEVLTGDQLSKIYGCPICVSSADGRYTARVTAAAW